MSRPSVAGPQSLSLTEELEKLEQSITLTLQEIDHNFSKAHRIVTNSILPIVEQYAERSQAVWEGSKFWKQFFEASANVSLSGYEENPVDETSNDDDEAQTTQDENVYGTPFSSADDTHTFDDRGRRNNTQGNDPVDSSLLESPCTVDDQSTPAMPASARVSKLSASAIADDYSSPNKALRGEGRNNGITQQTKPCQPTTPGKRTVAHLNLTPDSSRFAANATRQVAPPSTAHRPTANQDPLLHRVLDSNYRIMTTPHAQRKQKAPTAAPPAANTPGNRPRWRDTIGASPDSSPDVTAPQLRSDIFFSPMKAPRTPGVSVLPPRQAKGNPGAGGGNGDKTRSGVDVSSRSVGVWDSDSDGDGIEGMSPPKTMHFHIPQSRILQTPAREASKRIVENLLLTAGGDVTDDDDAGDSLSVVLRTHDVDDSF